MKKEARLALSRLRGSAAVAPLLLAATASLAQGGPPALPSGGTVAAGQASIVAVDPSSMLIRQQSSKAIINWQDFSIGAGASVTFQQLDNKAITLNRVTGSDMSAIQGNLSANGQIWLVNRNGILFGQGSRVDIGGLIATTSDIRDADFLSGHYDFNTPAPGPNAAVVNQGSIKAATGGAAVLSGNQVANHGVIQARLGRVVLGGAGAFSVSFDGDNLLQYQVNAPVSETPRDEDGKPAALVTNTGTISAQGGNVLMTARAARDVVDNVINTSGIIQARSASIQNGEVVLDAGDGVARVAGTVDVSGQAPGESGGAITVQGGKVVVADGAKLEASGDVDGGKVLIGGDLHGSGPVALAGAATVGRADIAANGANGHGGTIAIISSGITDVAATISAKGRAAGGTVETSGQDLKVASDARVNTMASDGPSGQWLLDPLDVAIDPAMAANITNSLANTNVTVTASHDLTVNAPLFYDSANALSLLAGHDLTVNASIQNSGNGSIMGVASGGSINLGAGTVIGASGPGDALVLAAAGNFNNHAGPAALNVAGGGRWLLFLDGPANNPPGALPALPFYDRAFDFTANGYTPVTSAGNRFVYAYAPVATVTAADQSRAYGAPNPALSATVTGLPGDLASGVFSGSAALSTTAVPNSPVGDYAITASQGTLVSDFNYRFQFVSGTLHIDPAVVTASLTGSVRKIYDGNAVADLSPGNYQVAGLLSGDTVTVSGPATGTYDSKNAGTGKLVSVTGLSLAGPDAANYLLASPNAAAAIGIIDPASLTASLTGSVRKVYDGTTVADLSATSYQVAGLLPGDTVTVSGPATGTFDNKNAGTGKLVSATGLTLAGADAGNYLLTNATAAIGTIDPATLTGSLTGPVRKAYDGTTVANLSAGNYRLAGLLPGDKVAVGASATGTYDSKNAGTGKSVSVTGLTLAGSDAGNYLLSSPSATAAIGIIDRATLTASLTGSVRKVYDGTTVADLSAGNYQLAGSAPGDSVALNTPATGTYDSKNAGTGKSVSVTGLTLTGSDAANYLLASPNATAAIGIIDPATLTASLTGSVRKVYDGTAVASLSAGNYQLAGSVSGDGVALNAPAAGTYDSKNVGTGKSVSVTGLALTGSDAGNYRLASPDVTAVIGIIDPATLTASLTGSVRKVYDGTTVAGLSAGNYRLAGSAPGDSIALNTPATGTYDSKNAGTGKLVSVTGLTLTGSDATNYLLASPNAAATIGTIDPASLTVELVGIVQKAADGTNIAILDPSNLDLRGVLSGDAVSLHAPATGLYDKPSPGTGKIVTVSGLTLSGADSGNYVLSSSVVSGAVGTIVLQRVTDLLGNSFTVNGLLSVVPPQSPLPAGRAASGGLDATSDIGEPEDATQMDGVAFAIGKSLSGNSGQSSSSALIDGLLRQFTPQVGSGLPHGVPPFGQVYSSWGNEAFWQ